ncbi:hypothetical protein L4Z64_001203 [Pseudomonas aeruginosa]|nr:hypothetical protein [Pseudomonas aeruginosa]HCH7782739.1 hypothetical protein [Pseudomonas aeruginosa]
MNGFNSVQEGLNESLRSLAPWAVVDGEVNLILLLATAAFAFVVMATMPVLVACLTGQRREAQAYASLGLLSTLAMCSVIGTPVGLIGFIALMMCAGIPPLGKAAFGSGC